jgi:hypothetical protein
MNHYVCLLLIPDVSAFLYASSTVAEVRLRDVVPVQPSGVFEISTGWTVDVPRWLKVKLPGCARPRMEAPIVDLLLPSPDNPFYKSMAHDERCSRTMLDALVQHADGKPKHVLVVGSSGALDDALCSPFRLPLTPCVTSGLCRLWQDRKLVPPSL